MLFSIDLKVANMTRGKILGSDETEQDEKVELEEFMDETDLDYVDTDHMLNGTELPEKNVRYALTRFVEDGPVRAQDFAEVLEGASEVWSEYLEEEEHNPRTVSEREADAYGAGAAGPDLITNAPRYSEKVEESAQTYEQTVEETLDDEYGTGTARKIVSTLLGPEEKADAELQIRDH